MLEMMLLAVLGKAISVKISGFEVKKRIILNIFGQSAVSAATYKIIRRVTYLISSYTPV